MIFSNKVFSFDIADELEAIYCRNFFVNQISKYKGGLYDES